MLKLLFVQTEKWRHYAYAYAYAYAAIITIVHDKVVAYFSSP